MRTPPNYEIFNAHKAREYWKALRARWVEAGQQIQQAILEIEEDKLRYAVAHMVDACASGNGAYVMVPSAEGFSISELELDDEIIDLLLDYTQGDTGITDRAYDWILDVLKGMPATFVAWAFGELTLYEPVVDDDGEPLEYLACDRVVYSLETRSIAGVHTYPAFGHRRNRIIPIRL
tara:strand:+ start:1945 stop:2475 length:531 start_codon:yes stop_codon:yes gene_type:complete